MSEPLLNEIRSTRPTAPDALREHVRSIAAQKPARAPFPARLEWRRLVLVAPAALAVALVAGTVIGLSRGDVAGEEQVAAGGGDAAVTSPAYDAARGQASKAAPAMPESANVAPATALDTGALPPATGRPQRYEAELRLRVEDVDALSSATKRAQQIALSLGGHVGSLEYDAPAEGIGAARITLRVPTARVQSAMAQLSALGTILGQRYGIQDLQQQADSLQTQIEGTQRRIAQILTRLESPALSGVDRTILQSRLAASRQKLTGLREAMRGTNAEARTATIYLSLATQELTAAEERSRLDDVRDVLAWEAVALLYALVVAGPFLVLGLLTWLALRLRRRRGEARLLERT